eukprot:1968017-Pyramimonas_sp.AAC.1
METWAGASWQAPDHREVKPKKDQNIVIPPSGAPDGPAGQGARLGSQATQSFGDGDPGASKPPPPVQGEAAPPPRDDDDSDGDGPGGVIVDDAPVVPDGRAPQRDSRPDDDTKQKLGPAHAEYRLDLQSFRVAQPLSR